jgi:hypothetical protein
MKTFFSILSITNPKTGERAICVCETRRDEDNICLMAKHDGHEVKIVDEGNEIGIYLNTYEFQAGI